VSEADVIKPASFVKSLRVTAVKFNSESPIASAAMSTAVIVSSTISVVSIEIPSTAFSKLPVILIPVPAL